MRPRLPSRGPPRRPSRRCPGRPRASPSEDPPSPWPWPPPPKAAAAGPRLLSLAVTKVYQGAPVYQAVVVVDAPQDVVEDALLDVVVLVGLQLKVPRLLLQTNPLRGSKVSCGSRFAEYVYGLYFSYFFSLFLHYCICHRRRSKIVHRVSFPRRKRPPDWLRDSVDEADWLRGEGARLFSARRPAKSVRLSFCPQRYVTRPTVGAPFEAACWQPPAVPLPSK